MNAEPNKTGEEPAGEDAGPQAEEPDQETDETPESDEMSELQAKVDENWDKFVRAAAELDNVRKRADRDVANAHKFALERFATDILAVCDSLDMALATEGEASVESLREGTEATLKLLNTVMERFGVEVLDPHGEPFDPNFHEAMTMQPSDSAEPGSVLNVFQKGYALNGRLLRPARVVVAAESAESAKNG
jgi:molecular chaperone GrpE